MNDREYINKITKLDLKLQAFVIIVMHIYL